MIYDTGNGLRVMILERRDNAAWAYWPVAWKRIEAFCRAYDSDADIPTLWQTLAENFASPGPQSIPLLLLDDKGMAIGHLLVCIEDWVGRRVCSIVQLEVDGALSAEVIDPAFDWIKRWAIAQGCEILQCFARNDAVARLFRQKYGFEAARTLMRQRLVKAEASGVSKQDLAAAPVAGREA